MFILKGININRALITLQIRGICEEHGEVLLPIGEEIFYRDKPIGIITQDGSRIVAIYTDPNFKRFIGYNESTGASCLDKAHWEINVSDYLASLRGPVCLCPNPDALVVYENAFDAFHVINPYFIPIQTTTMSSGLRTCGIFSQPSLNLCNDHCPSVGQEPSTFRSFT